MAVYGPKRLVDLTLPSGWDGAELERLTLQDGTTIAEVVSRLTTAIGGINAELVRNSLIGGLSYRSADRAIRYQDGGSGNEMQDSTEFGLPREERGEIEGHMAPLNEKDAGLGWSWKYLRKADSAQIDVDIAIMLEQVRNTFEKAPLTRLFASTHNLIATAGYDVGLADGNQSTVIWAPTPFDGQTFANTHTHYNEYATLDVATALRPSVEHLTEHGHKPPFIMLHSFADKATIVALTEFTGRAAAMIRYGLTQDIALISDEFLGVIDIDGDAVFVRLSHRIPTTYGCIYKSYGANSPRNPLRWCYAEDIGPGVTILADKAYRSFPVEGVMVFAEFGFTGGIDRTNGAVYEIASGGTYTVPTIT